MMQSIFSHRVYSRSGFASRSLVSSPNFKILGIETSCDDTGCAIVDSNGKILGEALNSQEKIHLSHGGIIPPIARDLHEENIKNVVDEALNKAKLRVEDIDAIATTVKPGLPLSLVVGMKYGKFLSKEKSKPFIPIHHMEAHALTIRMVEEVDFPFLVLLVSGGHCLLAVAQEVDKFLRLGETLDDAPGEAFDKVARRLKLSNLKEFRNMSGGQAIEKASQRGDPKIFEFPSILSRDKNCNFSFAGLKSKTRQHLLKKEKEHGIVANGIIPEVYDLCASFQLACTKHLCRRLQRAMDYVERRELIPQKNRTLVVSGGVACNSYIKKMLQHVCTEMEYRLAVPPPHLCTDNGTMIAWNGVERWRSNCGVIEPNMLDTVDIDAKCKLGESCIQDVIAANIKCRWVKLPVI